METNKYPQNLISEIEKYTGATLEVDSENPDIQKGITVAIATLKDQEQEIISMRYRQNMTFEAMGEHMGLTKERARQLTIKSVRKLMVHRREWIMYGLEGYIEREVEKRTAIFCKIKAVEAYREGYQKGIAVAKGEAESDKTMTINLQAITVWELDLSVRAMNCLSRAKYETLADLLNVSDANEIMRIRNLGKKNAGEVGAKLQELGFAGTAWDEFIQYWDRPVIPDDNESNCEEIAFDDAFFEEDEE